MSNPGVKVYAKRKSDQRTRINLTVVNKYNIGYVAFFVNNLSINIPINYNQK